MEGIAMETEGALYETVHCKKCGMLFFAKPNTLSRFCYTCNTKKVSQFNKQLSTQFKVNALKGVLVKN